METISRNLEDLTAFHSVATEGSFTRAAEHLGTSKAGLSKQVKRLESYLGVRLFHRTTRTLMLTEEGIILLNYSRKIFDLSNEASRRIRDVSQGVSGLIRVSAPISIGDLFFPSFLLQMKSILPQVRFELDLSNENRDFVRDEITFAIRASADHHPDVVARYLGRIKDVICASPDFFKKTKLRATLEDLGNHECILNSMDKAWNTWTFSSKTKDVSVDVSGSHAANQYTTARLLCLAGLGVARVPYYIVAEDIGAGRLIQLFSDYEITTHPLYLIYLQKDYPSKKHKIVKDAIQDWFRKQTKYFI